MRIGSERRLSAIILGAGVAGLSAGHALLRAGYRVAIYERAPALTPQGAALSLWANAQEALRRLGMLESVKAAAAQINSLSIVMASGRPLIESIALEDPGLIISRSDLQCTRCAG
jgi:FAD-dependent urate hydroxylase